MPQGFDARWRTKMVMSMRSGRFFGSPGPAAACAALLAWALVLLYPASPVAARDVPSFFRAVAVVWFLLNVYLWLVPPWRQLVIERRGPLLGFGFAFGAALISLVADAFSRGWLAALGLGAWRFLVLFLPFLPPLVARLPYRPRGIDLGVVILSLLLPILPGFQSLWFPVDLPGQGGGLFRSGLGPGALSAAALLWTYFYGVRFWTLAPLDFKARPGDLGAIAAASFLSLVAAVLLRWLPGELGSVWPVLPAGVWEAAWWLLTGIGLAALFETLVFRSILQAWITQGLTRRLSKKTPMPRLLAAAAAALLHAVYGPFGLSPELGFVISLALGLVYTRSNRYFPAAVAHGLILLVLAVAGRFL